MLRIILFILLVALAAFADIYVLDQHGVVSLELSSRVYETSLTVALAALLGLAGFAYFLVRALSFLLRLPVATFALSRRRRKVKAEAAISRGLVAVASGDLNAAARHAHLAERLAGHEPLALLLKAQASQLLGNRGAAKEAFTRMAEITDTRGLGLRGLFVEARRRGDNAAAHRHAVAAAQLDVFLPWAHEATLVAQCQARDWLAALATLERNHRLGAMDVGEMRRAKAALLSARALDLARLEPKEALRSALNALKIDPGLTPATTVAAKALAQEGRERKAARIIESAWRLAPHPDLAAAYAELRANLTAAERLKQVQRLVALKPEHEESAVALAKFSLAARQFAQARAALEPLLAPEATQRPTARVCLLMVEIEEAENGVTGLAREWLGRAAHAPRDPAWIADSVISSQWLPVAPESGRIGGFVWERPTELAAEPRGASSLPAPMPLPAPEPSAPASSLPAPPAEHAPEGETKIVAEPAAEPVAGHSRGNGADPEIAPSVDAAPALDATATVTPAPAARIEVTDAAPPERKAEAAPSNSGTTQGTQAKIESVAFPLERAPDDPGAGPPPPAKGFWKRLAG